MMVDHDSATREEKNVGFQGRKVSDILADLRVVSRSILQNQPNLREPSVVQNKFASNESESNKVNSETRDPPPVLRKRMILSQNLQYKNSEPHPPIQSRDHATHLERHANPSAKAKTITRRNMPDVKSFKSSAVDMSKRCVPSSATPHQSGESSGVHGRESKESTVRPEDLALKLMTEPPRRSSIALGRFHDQVDEEPKSNEKGRSRNEDIRWHCGTIESRTESPRSPEEKLALIEQAAQTLLANANAWDSKRERQLEKERLRQAAKQVRDKENEKKRLRDQQLNRKRLVAEMALAIRKQNERFIQPTKMQPTENSISAITKPGKKSLPQGEEEVLRRKPPVPRLSNVVRKKRASKSSNQPKMEPAKPATELVEEPPLPQDRHPNESGKNQVEKPVNNLLVKKKTKKRVKRVKTPTAEELMRSKEAATKERLRRKRRELAREYIKQKRLEYRLTQSKRMKEAQQEEMKRKCQLEALEVIRLAKLRQSVRKKQPGSVSETHWNNSSHPHGVLDLLQNGESTSRVTLRVHRVRDPSGSLLSESDINQDFQFGKTPFLQLPGLEEESTGKENIASFAQNSGRLQRLVELEQKTKVLSERLKQLERQSLHEDSGENADGNRLDKEQNDDTETSDVERTNALESRSESPETCKVTVDKKRKGPLMSLSGVVEWCDGDTIGQTDDAPFVAGRYDSAVLFGASQEQTKKETGEHALLDAADFRRVGVANVVGVRPSIEPISYVESEIEDNKDEESGEELNTQSTNAKQVWPRDGNDIALVNEQTGGKRSEKSVIVNDEPEVPKCSSDSKNKESYLHQLIKETDDSLSVVDSWARKVYQQQQLLQQQQQQQRKLMSVHEQTQSKEDMRVETATEEKEEREESLGNEMPVDVCNDETKSENNLHEQSWSSPHDDGQTPASQPSQASEPDLTAHSEWDSMLQVGYQNVQRDQPQVELDRSELLAQAQLHDLQVEEECVVRDKSPRTLGRQLLTQVDYQEALFEAHMQLNSLEHASLIEEMQQQSLVLANTLKEQVEANHVEQQLGLKQEILDHELQEITNQYEALKEKEKEDQLLQMQMLEQTFKVAQQRESCVQTDQLVQRDVSTSIAFEREPLHGKIALTHPSLLVGQMPPNYVQEKLVEVEEDSYAYDDDDFEEGSTSSKRHEQKRSRRAGKKKTDEVDEDVDAGFDSHASVDEELVFSEQSNEEESRISPGVIGASDMKLHNEEGSFEQEEVKENENGMDVLDESDEVESLQESIQEVEEPSLAAADEVEDQSLNSEYADDFEQSTSSPIRTTRRVDVPVPAAAVVAVVAPPLIGSVTLSGVYSESDDWKTEISKWVTQNASDMNVKQVEEFVHHLLRKRESEEYLYKTRLADLNLRSGASQKDALEMKCLRAQLMSDLASCRVSFYEQMKWLKQTMQASDVIYDKDDLVASIDKTTRESEQKVDLVVSGRVQPTKKDEELYEEEFEEPGSMEEDESIQEEESYKEEFENAETKDGVEEEFESTGDGMEAQEFKAETDREEGSVVYEEEGFEAESSSQVPSEIESTGVDDDVEEYPSAKNAVAFASNLASDHSQDSNTTKKLKKELESIRSIAASAQQRHEVPAREAEKLAQKKKFALELLESKQKIISTQVRQFQLDEDAKHVEQLAQLALGLDLNAKISTAKQTIRHQMMDELQHLRGNSDATPADRKSATTKAAAHDESDADDPDDYANDEFDETKSNESRQQLKVDESEDIVESVVQQEEEEMIEEVADDAAISGLAEAESVVLTSPQTLGESGDQYEDEIFESVAEQSPASRGQLAPMKVSVAEHEQYSDESFEQEDLSISLPVASGVPSSTFPSVAKQEKEKSISAAVMKQNPIVKEADNRQKSETLHKQLVEHEAQASIAEMSEVSMMESSVSVNAPKASSSSSSMEEYQQRLQELQRNLVEKHKELATIERQQAHQTKKQTLIHRTSQLLEAIQSIELEIEKRQQDLTSLACQNDVETEFQMHLYALRQEVQLAKIHGKTDLLLGFDVVMPAEPLHPSAQLLVCEQVEDGTQTLQVVDTATQVVCEEKTKTLDGNAGDLLRSFEYVEPAVLIDNSVEQCTQTLTNGVDEDNVRPAKHDDLIDGYDFVEKVEDLPLTSSGLDNKTDPSVCVIQSSTHETESTMIADENVGDSDRIKNECELDYEQPSIGTIYGNVRSSTDQQNDEQPPEEMAEEPESLLTNPENDTITQPLIDAIKRECSVVSNTRGTEHISDPAGDTSVCSEPPTTPNEYTSSAVQQHQAAEISDDPVCEDDNLIKDESETPSETIHPPAHGFVGSMGSVDAQVEDNRQQMELERECEHLTTELLDELLRQAMDDSVAFHLQQSSKCQRRTRLSPTDTNDKEKANRITEAILHGLLEETLDAQSTPMMSHAQSAPCTTET